MLGAACSECCDWWGIALRDWTGNCIGWNFYGRSWKRNPPGDGWSYALDNQSDFATPQLFVSPQALTEEWQTFWREGAAFSLGAEAWVNRNAPYSMTNILVEMRRVGQSVYLRLTIRGLRNNFLPNVFAPTSRVVITYERENVNFDKDVTEFTANDIKEFASPAVTPGQGELLVNWLQSHCGSIAILKKPRPPAFYGKSYSFQLSLDAEEVTNAPNTPPVTTYLYTLTDHPIVFSIQSENSCSAAVVLPQGCGYVAQLSLPPNISISSTPHYGGSFLFSGAAGSTVLYSNASEAECLPPSGGATIFYPNAARIAIHWVAFVAFSENGELETKKYAASALAGTARVVFQQKDISERSGFLALDFESCFGKKARGYVTFEDLGPITQATLNSGGIGYARRGRSAPTLTVANESSEAAQLTITLSQEQDECGVPYWRISAISVVDGGRGYTNDEALVITAASGTTVEAAATGTIATESVVEEPNIDATTEDGTGAELTVTLEQTDAEPSTWTITGVTFTGGTSGYVHGQEVLFGGDDVVEVVPAVATVVCKRIEPALNGAIIDFDGAVGLVLSYTLSQIGVEPDISWEIASVTVEEGGSGYQGRQGSFIFIGGPGQPEDIVFLSEAMLQITSVDQDGSVQSVSLEVAGSFYKNGDELDRIEVTTGGEYYGERTYIESIEIENGGVYYFEDASLNPYVADVTVSIVQPENSPGDGALIEAVVEDDTASANFGKIVGLILSAGGDSYTDNLSPGCDGNPLP